EWNNPNDYELVPEEGVYYLIRKADGKKVFRASDSFRNHYEVTIERVFNMSGEKGLGTIFYQKLEQLYKEWGYRIVKVEVRCDNYTHYPYQDIVQFWLKMGFNWDSEHRLMIKVLKHEGKKETADGGTNKTTVLKPSLVALDSQILQVELDGGENTRLADIKLTKQNESIIEIDWLGHDLIDAFSKLNKNNSIKIFKIYLDMTKGEVKQVKGYKKLERKLKEFPEDEFVILILEQDYSSSMDYKVIIDKASYIAGYSMEFGLNEANLDRILGDYSILPLESFEYVMNISVFPYQKQVWVHTISLGREFVPEFRGKKLMSKTFGKMAQGLGYHYDGYLVSAIILDEYSKRLTHLFNKYFGMDDTYIIKKCFINSLQDINTGKIQLKLQELEIFKYSAGIILMLEVMKVDGPQSLNNGAIVQEEAETPYVLIPKLSLLEFPLGRGIYSKSKKWAGPIRLENCNREILDLLGEMETEIEGVDREQNYEKMKSTIKSELERLAWKNVEYFEVKIGLYFNVFRKYFSGYPFDCDLAASLVKDLFSEQGYSVIIMEYRGDLVHYFVEIKDKDTQITWVFDPVAEQFKKRGESLDYDGGNSKAVLRIDQVTVRILKEIFDFIWGENIHADLDYKKEN
ncbi:MAG: hypothetical protein KAJ14_10725, partial [Candidatus Omnitrophica bacterium]|nr:hypothetical protein [Candidatus Omnitrophota bacterium]